MKFYVSDYGALPNGELCTGNIQAAIDDCFLKGGGEVVVSEGVYLVAGIRLRSNVTLHLLENAILKGSRRVEDYFDYLADTVEPISDEERESYAPTIRIGTTPTASVKPYSRWNNAIIRAIRAENIAIIGEQGSVIDGQNCYDPEGEEHFRGPHGIGLWYCKNITLRGYTLKDSGNWAHEIQNSKNIIATDITVLGGHDGFDARTSDNILIENSTFMTGDDCIAGFDNQNVVIRGCHFESACSIMRFGATDMLVENCEGVLPTKYKYRNSMSLEEKISGADTTEEHRGNCLTAFLYYCDNRAEVRATPGNILIRNCKFKDVDTVFDLPFGERWCTNRSLSDISFENCTFDGVVRPIYVNAPDEQHLTIKMRDL